MRNKSFGFNRKHNRSKPSRPLGPSRFKIVKLISSDIKECVLLDKIKSNVKPFFSNPNHVESYHIPMLARENVIYCTPKADGDHKILFVRTNRQSVYLQVELVGTNLYIIDLLSITQNNLSRTTLEERLDIIKILFGKNVLLNGTINQRLFSLVKSSVTCMNLKISSRNNGVKSPSVLVLKIKPVIKIKIPSITTENYHKFGDFLNGLLQPYKTYHYGNDGWIVYTSDRTPLKFKPLQDLTIDVMYLSGKWQLQNANDMFDISSNITTEKADYTDGIYRCIVRKKIDNHTSHITASSTDNNSNSSDIISSNNTTENTNSLEVIPQCIRTDKSVPNPYSYYDHIGSRIINDLNPVDILGKYLKSRDTYYEHYCGESNLNYDRKRRPIRTDYPVLIAQDYRVDKIAEKVTEILRNNALKNRSAIFIDSSNNARVFSCDDNISRDSVSNNRIYRILDLGAGKCTFYRKIKNHITDFVHRQAQKTTDMKIQDIFLEYYGLDIDPDILGSYSRPSNLYRVWGSMNADYVDRPNPFEKFTSYMMNIPLYQTPKEFDVFTFLNSVHNVEDLEKIFQQLIGLVNSIDGGYIIIFGLFSDLILQAPNAEFERDFYIRHIEHNTFEFRYPWRSEKPFVESIYSTHQIESIVESIPQLEFVMNNMHYTESITPNLSNPELKAFLDMHRCYVIRIKNKT